MEFKTFIFNPFQENTYILWDETNECIIIDAGNYLPNEDTELSNFIDNHNLKPVLLINTHNHLDHIFGSYYLTKKYHIEIACHPDGIFLIPQYKQTAQMYGLNVANNAPEPQKMLNHNNTVTFGNTTIKVLHVPGHSPGCIALYNEQHNILFSGDILFNNSIGRSDLPGGNHNQLINGIKNHILTLPNKTDVYPGHGPKTTIGNEKTNNPFLIN